jgi:hypothetical protein
MLLLLAISVALVAPAASPAQGGQDIIRDCAQDGDLDGDYSQEELDEAYENMPSDIDEYSNCRSVIESARARAGSDDGGNGGSSGGGIAPGGSSDGTGGAPGGSGNDSEELQARGDRAKSGDAPKATVAGETAVNDGGTFTTDAESNGMSSALIVVLILAALGALAGALYLLRDQLPASIASRLPGPLKPDSRV